MLHERIAETLQREFEQSFPVPAPSITKLAQQHATSYRTMWRALQVLAERGIVDCSKGKRLAPGPRLRGGTPGNEDTLSRSPSVHRAYMRLRDKISSGAYLSGNPLPKNLTLCSDLGVSMVTLKKALHLLQNHGIVHQSGRRFIAGGKPPEKSCTKNLTASASVVLLVFHDDYALHWLFRKEHVPRFYQPLLGELQKFGYSIVPVKQEKAIPDGTIEIGGLPDTVSFVKSLGSRYQGAIIHDSGFQHRQNHAKWIRELCLYNKPVFLFDKGNECEQFTRSKIGKAKNYFRLHLGERDAVRLALQELYRLGHRKFLFPNREPGRSAWAESRIALAREICSGIASDTEFFISDNSEPFWIWNTPPDRKGVIMSERIMEHFSPRRASEELQSVQRAASASTPSIIPFIENGVSAILALNDHTALEYYRFLRIAGIDVPKRLSLISFDNLPRSVFTPISTIDFGFEHLGYTAAHVIIGDIGHKPPQNGEMPGRCVLYDRGSIGPPAVQ